MQKLESIIAILDKELKKSAADMTTDEARYLVDAYYGVQNYRIHAQGQIRSHAQRRDDQPLAILEWVFAQMDLLERRVKTALHQYAKNHPVGEWSLGICGVGPVISAGLLAHIDIIRAPTVGHIWAFAGLDPTREWKKKEKRPWNAQLKTLCWKIGESFVKTSNNQNGIYGKIYQQRKLLEEQRNTEFAYKDQAAHILETKTFRDKKSETYKAYAAGMLPKGHIHARAKRYAVKLFLAHWHDKAYWTHYNKAPPLPYAIAILKHGHMIEREA